MSRKILMMLSIPVTLATVVSHCSVRAVSSAVPHGRGARRLRPAGCLRWQPDVLRLSRSVLQYALAVQPVLALAARHLF